METRKAIRQGRVLADEGLFTHAHDAWKDALSGAYASQDYPGMFVLSSNVGKACVRLAAEEKDVSRARELLMEAMEHLDYALQVVEQCSLRGVMGGYRALYMSVRRVEDVRRKAEEQLQQLEEKEERKCATCGEKGDMVLDENDGCDYCRRCYEDFYAADVGTEAVVEALETLEREEDEEIAAVGSDSTREVEVVVDERKEEVGQGGGEVETTDRIRNERVELGSLADFLAGKPPVGDIKEKSDVSQIDSSRGPLLPADTALVNARLEEEPVEDLISAVFDQKDSDDDTPTSDGGAAAACVKEGPTLSEEERTGTTDANSGKFQYSVAQLLELRQHSPDECPETLVASPVRDDGSAPSLAHNKAGSNGRKKANSSKKTSRSADSHRQNKSDTAGSKHAEEKKTDAAPQVSPLPTLAMCAAMREAFDAQSDGGAANCDSPIASGTLDIAATPAAMLSDSPSTLHPLVAHVRLQ